MLHLPNYVITQHMGEGPNASVYKGFSGERVKRPCLIKQFHLTNPSVSNIARTKQIYKNLQKLSSPGVLEIYEVLEQPEGLVLVFEDIPLFTLQSLLAAAGPISLHLFFQISIPLAATLQELHQHHIVHGSIKPANILIHPDTYQPKLWDFGIFSLIHPSINFFDPHFLTASLPYMSPEQSGRLHRTADYRTDLYSLGITFYEMLAGKPPFESSDPLEIIHSHLARNPKPLSAISANVPQVVSDIVLKLLAKEPASRYQSGRGVWSDLANCQHQFCRDEAILPFKLGQYDQADKFLISQRLYGRDQEIKRLHRAVKSLNTCAKEIILVTGEAGVGKSALVNEINSQVIRQQGYFAAGNYEQLTRNKAYSGILQAVRHLVQQILSEGEEQVADWKRRFDLALGRNASVLIDLAPEIGQLLPAPAKSEPSVSVNPNRLNLLFEQFIGVFAAKGRSLVFFFDNLQWVDFASLDLIQHLMLAPGINHTLVIAAYREDEVQPAHPLLATINEAQKAGVSLQVMHLSSLALATVNQWMADTFSLEPEATTVFSEMVHYKTGGNPFFIKLFLQTLYEENILTFDGEAGWQWDLPRVQQLEATANVVNLMLQRISLLPLPARRLLNLAACVGAEFSLDTIAAVAEHTQEGVYLDLEPAITAGIIFQSDEKSFRFAHGRVQQAIYAALAPAQKQQIHWQIGHYWLAQHQTETQEDRVFDVVNQLNLGQACIETEAECLQLLTLNLAAGQKAEMTAAYQSAYEYVHTALALTPSIPEGWEAHHDIWLDLYNEAIKTAYLSGHLDAVETLASVLLSQARTIHEKQKTFQTQIQLRLSQNQLAEAVALGREVLAELGIMLPEEPVQADFEAGYERIQQLLHGREIATLIDLPPMQTPDGLMAMRILSAISTAVWTTSPILYALDVFKRVELSLIHGNAPTSAAAYGGLGVILCSQIGDVQMGHRFGQLALEIVKKYQLKNAEARTIGAVYSFTFHWLRPLHESLQPALEGHQIGIDAGDFNFAASNAYLYTRHAYCSGHNLTALNHHIHALIRTVRQLKQERAAHMLNMDLQICLNLQKETAEPYRLVGSAFNEEEMLSIYQARNDNSRISTVLCNKLMLAYLFGAYDEAVRLAHQVEERVVGLSASIYLPLFNFYDSLTHLAVYAGRIAGEQAEIGARVAANQKRLHEWAGHAPMNFQHKWLLVAAEQAAISQDFGQAREYYDEAIRLAGQHGYVQEEGLANERAAYFYLGRGQEGLARFYAQAALECYGRWGAAAKQKSLKTAMPQLFMPEPAAPGGLSGKMMDTAVENVLQYASVLKATRILSEEIVLEKLIEKLMRVVIENAGAERGYLIMPQNDQLKIQAVVSVESEDVNLFQDKPIDVCKKIAATIVHHVAQFGETVLLHHAAREGDFTHDPNIIAHQTKSVLCMKIQRQQEIMGILYLENNLTTHAFTETRIELLQILLSQAAISLQNATYYENLKQEIEERKLAEERLRTSEAEWRSLVDNAPDTIMIVSRDMRVRFVNRLLPTLRREDVIGELIYNFVLPEDQALVKENIEFVFNHGAHAAYESTGPGENGKMGWYITRLGPILHEGEVVGVTMVATDITKRRETEDKLHLYMAELERSNRELQDFAYISSHDLQEPLRKIQTFSDRLADKYQDVLDERGLDYLRRMQNAAARMQTLIEDLLAFSRVTTKAMPFSQIDLNEVLHHVLSNLEVQIEQTNAQIHVAPLHRIEADKSQMLHLFQNLISNALKFHREGVAPKIEVTDERIFDHKPGVPFVRITVEDNGIGFEEQYAERIFGVFQRLHGRDRYEGTGVGLAICRKITDRHHGHISAISQPNQGTKIIVLLPQFQSGIYEAHDTPDVTVQD